MPAYYVPAPLELCSARVCCRHVGGLLEFADSQCCVAEDGQTSLVCGYVVTCADVAQYYKWFDETWLPSLQDKCSSPKLSNTSTDTDNKVRVKLLFHYFIFIIIHCINIYYYL